MIRVVHPGFRIPDPDADFLPIPAYGSRDLKGTGSRIRISNIGANRCTPHFVKGLKLLSFDQCCGNRNSRNCNVNTAMLPISMRFTFAKSPNVTRIFRIIFYSVNINTYLFQVKAYHYSQLKC
jgi:hypothetical protein